MDILRTLSWRAKRVALLAGTLAAFATAIPSPSPALASEISSNWAGYVTTSASAKSIHFRTVSGTWTEPSATCSTGKATYSAVWVGLGGNKENARALEQIGTDADCSRSGRASYSTWVELVPAAPVDLHVKAHPGDQMKASVTVIGRDATLRISNLSTDESSSTTIRPSRIDTSSAEWIVEAPSLCLTTSNCRVLSLTDFGRVQFANATATTAGHTGTITDADWESSELQLRQSQRVANAASPRTSSAAVVLAMPTIAAPASGAFAVEWSEEESEAPSSSEPTGPEFAGGSPP